MKFSVFNFYLENTPPERRRDIYGRRRNGLVGFRFGCVAALLRRLFPDVPNKQPPTPHPPTGAGGGVSRVHDLNRTTEGGAVPPPPGDDVVDWRLTGSAPSVT